MPRKKEFEPQNRLRKIRQEQRKSLQEIATTIKVTPAEISRLETGERQLNLNWMRKLSKSLGKPPADLLLTYDGGLSTQERALIEAFRELPQIAQKGVIAHIDGVRALLKK